MRQVCMVLFLFQLISPATHGQEDSLKMRINPTFNQSTDLLPLKKSLMIRQSVEMDTDLLNLLDSTFKNKTEVNFAYHSVKQKRNLLSTSYSKFVIPAVLITYGTLSSINKEDDKKIQLNVAAHNFKPFKVDDYLQYAPIITVYGLDLIGVKAKHNLRDRTFLTATSYLIMGTSVYIAKSQTNVLRPNGSNYKSFPSGHTATVFVGAHLLFKEYNHVSLWIPFAGYSVAAITGAMRVRNNKHWLSDVITGAGVGMLSVELGYLMLPLFHKIMGISGSDKNIVIAPAIGNNRYGLGLAYAF